MQQVKLSLLSTHVKKVFLVPFVGVCRFSLCYSGTTWLVHLSTCLPHFPPQKNPEFTQQWTCHLSPSSVFINRHWWVTQTTQQIGFNQTLSSVQWHWRTSCRFTHRLNCTGPVCESIANVCLCTCVFVVVVFGFFFCRDLNFWPVHRALCCQSTS